MKLIDDILFYISAPKCVGCKTRLDRNDKALCKTCYAEYKNVLDRNCSICSKKLNRCTCTNFYMDSHYVHKMIKVYRYIFNDGIQPSNFLIYSLKRDNRKDVLDFLADELADSISSNLPNYEKYICTSVPRRRSEIIKYGIDHAELLSRAVAKRLKIKYIKTLVSNAKYAQKKATSRDARYKNAKFKLKSEALDLKGKDVIVVDDIVTTGASMGMSAMLLKSAGAGKIIGASIAIAYKDAYTPFATGDRFFVNK